jgi:hypothetical protein
MWAHGPACHIHNVWDEWEIQILFRVKVMIMMHIASLLSLSLLETQQS